MVKTYLKPSKPDYAPDTAIQLGLVWTDPRDPGSFIGQRLSFPEDIKVNHSWKDDWATTDTCENHGTARIWARFIEFLGPHTGTRWDRSQSEGLSCARMDTYSIEPTPQYVRDSVQAVQQSTLQQGHNLYMITGLKIARHGRAWCETSSGVQFDGGVSADVTPFTGIPLGAGIEAGIAHANFEGEKFAHASDFVFAYRVREIFYKKSAIRTREYNKGALHGSDVLGYDDAIECYNPEVEVTKTVLSTKDVVVKGESLSFRDDDEEECEFIWI